MKKISAVFDGLKFSEGTLAYALEFAAKSKALLCGVFLDSFLYHSYRLTDVIGEQGVSAVKIKHLDEKDAVARRESSDSFEQACREAGVNYTVHHDQNLASVELLKESIYSDLVVISASETLSQYTWQSPAPFLREFLADTQCPVLVVPEDYKKIEKVVLLYDGKPASVYAIKMFNYMLPWLRNKSTEVLSVTDPKDMEELPAAGLMREFIQSRYPNATYTLLKGDAEQEILSYLHALPSNALIVLGAYQRGQVSRWFKASMADALLKKTKNILFIAHQK